MNKPFVVVSCPLDTYSGYGSRARDIVRALVNSEKYDVKVLSQRWGSTPFGFLKEDNPEDKKLLDCILPPPLQRQPDVWIQITVPNEFQKIGKFIMEELIYVWRGPLFLPELNQNFIEV